MPKFNVTSPDGTTYSVNAPEGATEDDAIAYIQREHYQAKNPSDVIQPSAGIGERLGNLYEGAKLAASAPFIGGGNLVGMVPDERVKQFKQDVSANMDKPGGFGGQVIGGGLAAAPVMAIPGMQGPAAQMALGGLYGLTYPAEGMKERAINTGSGIAGSGAGYLAGNLLNKANSPFLNSAQRKAMDEASRNSMRDAALAEGQAAGYVIPRSDYAPSFIGNRLESIGGKAAIKQESVRRNQEVTNKLARETLGLSDETPISVGTLEKIRTDNGKVYQEVGRLSKVAADDLQALKQARSDAKAWYESYNRSANPEQLTKAKEYNDIATMLEQSLEQHAAKAGKDELIPALREARKNIAQTYTAERALNKATGDVSAPVLGRLFDKKKPLSGGFETIGKMNAAFPKFTGNASTNPAAGVSKSEAIMGLLLGAGGAGLSGSPYGMMAATLPLLSHPARSVALSKLLQRPKSYSPGFTAQLAPRLGRTLPGSGSAAAIGLLED